MKKMMMRFLKDEDGVTMIEYSLIAALIAVAAIATITIIGNDVNGIFGNIQTSTSAAPGGVGA